MPHLTTDDVDSETLPYCADCGAHEWRLQHAVRDGHRTMRLYECADCGAVGGRRERDDEVAIHYDGAFDA